MTIHIIAKQNDRMQTGCGIPLTEVVGQCGFTSDQAAIKIAFKKQAFDCHRCRYVAQRQPELMRILWMENG